jgi:hypothetical protein
MNFGMCFDEVKGSSGEHEERTSGATYDEDDTWLEDTWSSLGFWLLEAAAAPQARAPSPWPTACGCKRRSSGGAVPMQPKRLKAAPATPPSATPPPDAPPTGSMLQVMTALCELTGQCDLLNALRVAKSSRVSMRSVATRAFGSAKTDGGTTVVSMLYYEYSDVFIEADFAVSESVMKRVRSRMASRG